MTRSLRFLTTLFLLLAIICACSLSPASAEAVLAPESRQLRQELQQVDAPTTSTSNTNSPDSVASSPTSVNTEASAGASTQTTHEGPTTMSFVGPAIAGVLAIVLIGAVVTFKNRAGK